MMKKVLAWLSALALLMSMSAFAADSVPAEESQAEAEARFRKSGAVFLHIGNYATVSDGTLKWIDMANKSVMPYIKNERTMVPLRFLAEEMGAVVGYNAETAGITITLDETVMELTVGSTAYALNGEVFQMDCAAEIFEDRTFVPVRFVSEALGKSVEWLDVERIVVVTPADSPWNKENSAEKAVISEVQLMLSPLVRNNIKQ